MYNLLVGFAEDTAIGGRVFEYTDDGVLDYVRPSGKVDLLRVSKLPTIVMPEVGSSEPQVARVGRPTDLEWTGDDLRFRFVPNATVDSIPLTRLRDSKQALGIADWEFSRTHWAVKAIDLYGVLADANGSTVTPHVFALPAHESREDDLVAVMMPFDPSLDPVYQALKMAAAQAGFRCLRADDIWEHPHVMDDILSLIWRAKVIVSDFTGKNANVFYETGIAHTIGRDVVPITQVIDDVPFDLRSIRTLTYLNNGEGRTTLTSDLASKLRSLANNA